VRPVLNRSQTTILTETQRVIDLYQQRGFIVRDVHADNEFECIRTSIGPVAMDIVPADSHVGEIERSNRTLKERTRTCVHGLPFKRLPKLMVAHIVKNAVTCLNQFPWKHGISQTMSPDTIMTGKPPPDFTKMRLEFGSYVQVFEDNDPSNTIKARSTGAIALSPTGNAHGDYFFMSLATGARLSRHRWTELPITDTAIARVEAIAKNEDQPLVQDSGLVIEWRPDHPIDDDEYDTSYALPKNAIIDDHNFFDDAIDAAELLDLHADHDFALPLAPAPVQGAYNMVDENNNDNDNNNDENENELEAPGAHAEQNENENENELEAPGAHAEQNENENEQDENGSQGSNDDNEENDDDSQDDEQGADDDSQGDEQGAQTTDHTDNTEWGGTHQHRYNLRER
jgi:hypothetical protein